MTGTRGKPLITMTIFQYILSKGLRFGVHRREIYLLLLRRTLFSAFRPLTPKKKQFASLVAREASCQMTTTRTDRRRLTSSMKLSSALFAKQLQSHRHQWQPFAARESSVACMCRCMQRYQRSKALPFVQP